MRDSIKLTLAAVALCATAPYAHGQANFDVASTQAGMAARSARLAFGRRLAPFETGRIAALAASRRAGAAAPSLRPPTVPSGVTFLEYPGAAQTVIYSFNPGVRPTKKEYFAGAYDNTPGGGFYPFGMAAQLASSPGGLNESFQTILPGTTEVFGYGVNDANDIVGEVPASSACPSSGFVLSKGTMTLLNPPFAGATGSTAYGINNAGLVVGAWYADSLQGPCTPHGFTWKKGIYQQLPDPPNSVGVSVFAVNSAGHMSGEWYDSNLVPHGFFLANGVYTEFDPPGSLATYAGGLNDSDVILGGYCTTQSCTDTYVGTQWFTWSNGNLTAVTLPWPVETTSTIAETINNAGTMLGSFIDQAGYIHSFTLTQ